MIRGSIIRTARLATTTFVAEAIRAVAAGVIETALATFAILIAVSHFQFGPGMKSLLLASPALGLLGSLLVLPWVARAGLTSSAAAALVSLVSMSGFALAALWPDNPWCFVIGISAGMGIIGLSLPLQTHYLRLNYPESSRGRLFSVTIFLRALTAMVVSWIFGELLDKDLGRYPILLWTLVGAAAVSALCHIVIPSTTLQETGAPRWSFSRSVRLSWADPVFVQLLASAMVLGLGVLAATALRVDYLVHPRHGLSLDVKTVSLITGVIPSVARLVSTFFWGWLFDRIDFLRLRTSVNLVFLLGIVLYYGWHEVWLIMIGSALFGLARGGGEIHFNLFVTKIAAPEHIADYMAVHTFLAGVRMVIAPFLGFYIVQYGSVSLMAAVSLALVIWSIVMVLKVAKTGVGSPATS